MDKVKLPKIELILLLIILAAAAFFRFYKIGEYMTFLGDEGRDMLVMKQILEEYDLPFVGPGSSVGNIYLGPLYYYMVAVSMFIFGLNPVVASGMVALIGVITVYLIYYLGKLFFNSWSGLTAAWLYAISPVAIVYAKSSWNPNPAPFFSLLTILTVARAYLSDNWRWLILGGALTSAAVQMHYLTLPLIPAAILVVWRKSWGFIIKGVLGFIAGFNLLLLPWWLFEFKHDFLNSKGFIEIFFGAKSRVGGVELSFFEKFFGTTVDTLVGHYLAGGFWLLSLLVVLMIVGFIIWGRKSWGYNILGTTLLTGLIFINFYKGAIYEHYVGYLVPVVYLLLGSAWQVQSSKIKPKNIGVILFVAFLLGLTIINLRNNPLLIAPNRQLQRTQEISRYVIAQAGDKPFNFALIAKNNYDSAYQFYLGEYGHKPKVVPEEVTDQLFVVCEDAECIPINHPKYEIAAFGWARIESVEEFAGVKVFKLVANPSGKPG